MENARSDSNYTDYRLRSCGTKKKKFCEWCEERNWQALNKRLTQSLDDLETPIPSPDLITLSRAFDIKSEPSKWRINIWKERRIGANLNIHLKALYGFIKILWVNNVYALWRVIQPPIWIESGENKPPLSEHPNPPIEGLPSSRNMRNIWWRKKKKVRFLLNKHDIPNWIMDSTRDFQFIWASPRNDVNFQSKRETFSTLELKEI